jgi:hypothetical protein
MLSALYFFLLRMELGPGARPLVLPAYKGETH